MTSWVVAFILLNLLDMASTLAVVSLGLGQELNPLMQALLEISPWAFVTAKVGTSLLAVPFLHAQVSRTGRFLFQAVVMLFVALMLWHAINWLWILRYSM